MTRRSELLTASDATIDDAVKYADPMVLRGLLYQLTGDESVAAIALTAAPAMNAETVTVSNPPDLALLRSKAAAFLKSYRDQGAEDLPCGKPERLLRSLSLTAGVELPESELELWVEQLALDPWARGLVWRKSPAAEDLARFTVAVIGAGMGGLNAAVHLKRAGIPYFVLEKNAEVGGTWYENRYPGARVDSPSRTYTHLFGVDFGYPNAFCPQRENVRYFKWVAEHFGVREDIAFNTEVKSVVWDETAKLWEISADGPDGPGPARERDHRERRIPVATAHAEHRGHGHVRGPLVPHGPLASRPRPRGQAGRGDRHRGHRLPADPRARQARGHTLVFQRTPNWCFDARLSGPVPTAGELAGPELPVLHQFRPIPPELACGPDNAKQVLRIDPAFRDPHARSARNKKVREERLAFIQRKLATARTSSRR